MPTYTLLLSFILLGIPLILFSIYYFLSNNKRLILISGKWKWMLFLNSNLSGIIFDFIRLNIAIVPILIILRLYEYHSLVGIHSLPHDILLIEWKGLLHDLVFWQILSWTLFLPFILLSEVKRWVGIVLYVSVFLVSIISEWTLFQYFKIALTPLDQVIFSYSLKEMLLITGNCVQINFLTFLPYLVFISLTLLLLFLSRTLRVTKIVIIFIFFISAGLVIFRDKLIPKETENRNSFEYYLTINKNAYLIGKCRTYFAELKQSATDKEIKAAIKRYHAAHSEFVFLGSRYPFLHYENTPDVLSTFFDLKKEKPNLVFIICESLSSCFSGNNKIFGSFTPFLDSLATEGLYWPNFLSSADRTFNILPAIFGSLPPGDATFYSPDYVPKLPYHFSLIRYLHDGSYFTSFFYGGDPSFNNMDSFLKLQKTDFILNSFGPKYHSYNINEGYGWGYSDYDLFSRSFDIKDSIVKSPRLDIFLTLSLHTPFIIPNQSFYVSKVDEILKKRDPNAIRTIDIVNYKNIFATILYTDQALREFFNKYSKRPEFKNTIFIVTGDHGMPELNLARFSGLERFHVPLIVFSPLLKSRKPSFYSISSHLDIAPSFLAMLHKKFGLKINSVATWLGSGIDTTRAFSNKHMLPFILNSKEIPEYVDHETYYCPEGLCKILPGFFQQNIHDPKSIKGLNQELEDFNILNKYVARNNKLLPPEIYFGKVLISDTVKYTDPLRINPKEATPGWKTLLNNVPLNLKFKLVKLEFTIDYTTSKPSSTILPLLIFDVQTKSGKRVLWKSFEFPAEIIKEGKPDVFKPIQIEEYIDLSYLHKIGPFFLKIYIWNRDGVIKELMKPQVNIIGYY